MAFTKAPCRCNPCRRYRRQHQNWTRRQKGLPELPEIEPDGKRGCQCLSCRVRRLWQREYDRGRRGTAKPTPFVPHSTTWEWDRTIWEAE